MMKKILRRAPLALACLAAFGAASAANVDPQLTASSRDADALIVFAKSSHTVAPLAPDADYKMRRRALVDSLRAQADVSQRDVRSWLDAHGIAYRSYWVSNVIEARLSQSAIAELAGRNDIASIKSNRAFAMPLPQVEQGTAPSTIEAIPYGVTKIDAAPKLTVISFVANPPVEAIRIIELVQKNRHIKLAGNDRLRIEREVADPRERAQLARDVLRSLGAPKPPAPAPKAAAPATAATAPAAAPPLLQ